MNDCMPVAINYDVNGKDGRGLNIGVNSRQVVRGSDLCALRLR